MSLEEQKIQQEAVHQDIKGLQNANRKVYEELNQAVSLLGQLRQEHEMVKADTRRLQGEMEKVYTYLNKNHVR